MKDSERLTAQGTALLRQQGWPREAIKELCKILIQAGYYRCLEDQRDKEAEKEALIQKVTG